jgi:outer membrane protein
MKPFKSIFILFIAFCMATTFGQTTKGKFLLSGSSSFGFSSTSEKWKTDDNDGKYGSQINVSLDPMAGIFIAKGLAVGLDVQINYSRYKDDDPADINTSTTLAAGPFARYYIGKGKIKPYGHLSFGGGKYQEKSKPVDGPDATHNYGIMALKVGGGIGIFLNDNVSLDLGLQYYYYTSKAKENNANNFKTKNGEIGLNAGIVVIL